ncbi:uncharacterized protein LOC135373372 [Ornithodoros turicata]|uniref:uncharacterized protein LOC135373372 n=1 Tax=Ornithodoros turicata TaxID=34597 RepID=UPI003138ACEF
MTYYCTPEVLAYAQRSRSEPPCSAQPLVTAGVLKPDIVASRDEQTVILDVQIVGTGIALELAHGHKTLKYSGRDLWDQVCSGGPDPLVSSVTHSFRGVWAKASADILLDLGLRKRDISTIAIMTLQGGADC